MRTFLYATLAAALLALLGCGGSEEKPKPAARTAAGPVPSALGETESSAEDLVDFARARNRSKVVKGAKELRRLAEVPAARALEKAHVSDAETASLQARARLVNEIAAHASFLRVSLAANQVSGLMPDLYAHFTDPVPPAVLKLDYLDREAQLRSIANDRPGTLRPIAQLSSTWKALRFEVVKANGKRTATRFSRHVAKMSRAARSFDRDAIRTEAVSGLALVDELEGVFRRNR